MSKLCILWLFLWCGWELQAQNPGVFLWRDTFCSNQIVLINGNFYGPNNPTGTEIIPGGAFNGADSIIQVQFTFFQQAKITLNQNLCTGDTLWVNNQAYHANRWLGQEIVFGGAANGCDSIIDISLHVVPTPVANFQASLCPDTFLIVNGVKYDADNLAGAEVLPAAAWNGCDSIVNIDLEFFNPTIDLGPDREIVLGESVCLNAGLNFTPATTIWLPATPCTEAICTEICGIFPLENTNWVLTAVDSNGCIVRDEIIIRVSNEQRVFAPNVFKPTDESANNRFYIGAGAGITRIENLLIFDRWGNTLFESGEIAPNDPAAGWDGTVAGKMALPGVYVFLAQCRSIDGSLIVKSGDLVLIR